MRPAHSFAQAASLAALSASNPAARAVVASFLAAASWLGVSCELYTPMYLVMTYCWPAVTGNVSVCPTLWSVLSAARVAVAVMLGLVPSALASDALMRVPFV